MPCSVLVLTLNSGKTLKRCLESIKEFSEIIILDGNSTDDTLAIARQYTDKIFPQEDSREQNIQITDFAKVRNRGLKLALHDWFLFIDSDEYLSREAVREMREIVARGKENAHFVYNLPRRYVFEGRVLERVRPTYQPRFFYRSAVLGFKKRVHERIMPKEGYAIGTLTHPEFVPLEDIRTLRKKWAYYLDIEQEKTRDITAGAFLKKLRANAFKFCAYMLKACYAKLRHPRGGMPFVYEFYNAWYHLQIIQRSFANLVRNTFNKSH